MVSEAADGHGGESFHSTFCREKNLDAMMHTFIKRKPEDTIIDQWQSQIFARIMINAHVIFVSDSDDRLVEDFQMIPAHSMKEAMDKARRIIGKEDYKVTGIPDAVSIIVKE